MAATFALALALLAAVLLSTVSRWSEVTVAVPAAGLLVAIGAVPLPVARTEVLDLLPVVAFLGTLLLLAAVCDDEGLFQVFGSWLAHSGARQPQRLLTRVFLLAAATTAVLSLDATVVLLTPVVLGATRILGVPSRPHLYASAHLANSASLLLPVSNLTNLLAFSAAGLSFGGFALAMLGPWIAVIAAEFVLLKLLFRRDLVARPAIEEPQPVQPVPLFVLVILGLTLAGFAATSAFGLSPAWAALAGAAVLGIRSLAHGRSTSLKLLRSVNLPFLIFVLALGVVVKAVLVNGGDVVMRSLLPDGTGLPALFAIAIVAAVLSNVVNNLPATLVLLTPLAAIGPVPVMAALIGVNIGPNLTYVGSLSNLLWRRVLIQGGKPTSATEFSAVGLATVPVCIAAGVLALWAGTRLIGV